MQFRPNEPLNMQANNQCLGVVLAGGLSSRMGENKAHLNHFSAKQQDMLNFSRQLLHNAGIQNTLISGDNYQVADEFKQLGPLAGIYSVIKKYQPKAVLVIPVDLPLLTQDILTNLKLKGELSGQACFYQDHYLPLYLPNNAYSELFFNQAFTANKNDNEQALSQMSNKRGPSMRKFLTSIPHQVLPLKNSQVLFNCNTPEQWQQAQQLYSKI
jgi:molybdopterin-guanine dinucleotide biosynthesis protein A